MSVFIIEDEFHAERVGEFASRELAEAQLQQIAELPYGVRPNAAPCGSSATCHREYCIIEYEVAVPNWIELRRDHVLTTSAKEAEWVKDA